jgi:predicted nuclease of predicted toxin-antitoxin system
VKLLLDQNLSHRLAPTLGRRFPGSRHVKEVGLDGASDESIWRYARLHGFTVITKDADFMHRSLVRGFPPKIIQLQVGNASTDQLAALIRARTALISRFLKDRSESLLILT